MMKRASIFLMSMLLCVGLTKALRALELDASILRERVRRVHGDFSLKAKGDWQVSYDGKIVTWKWTEKGWVCPVDEKISCKEWVPTSFKWWVEGKGWLERWSPLERAGFDIGRPRITAKSDVGGAGAEHSAETGDGVVDSGSGATQDLVSSVGHSDQPKRWAHEVWEWKSSKGESAKLYFSLVDQRIERVDFADATEYLEWKDLPSRTAPELVRVIIEKSGIRMNFAKNAK